MNRKPFLFCFLVGGFLVNCAVGIFFLLAAWSALEKRKPGTGLCSPGLDCTHECSGIGKNVSGYYLELSDVMYSGLSDAIRQTCSPFRAARFNDLPSCSRKGSKYCVMQAVDCVFDERDGSCAATNMSGDAEDALMTTFVSYGTIGLAFLLMSCLFPLLVFFPAAFVRLTPPPEHSPADWHSVLGRYAVQGRPVPAFLDNRGLPAAMSYGGPSGVPAGGENGRSQTTPCSSCRGSGQCGVFGPVGFGAMVRDCPACSGGGRLVDGRE
eukprot:TRINITY_DN14388_c0_g1_i1.p1 TRINITY_DN14388_c0_g1~~TRINITY_DN14388_c0_g1_i1.p1  ORF type:complete len:267 (-),score=26.39 TRINITY_DN14388_c0_g1_i1:290-1090(-)